ncbi:hypothetical protein V493_08498 [Pseudogymnoascus sp. VKM F-4281 (FW-2241)]|nr:hypothetical protein V493_08498 [Pseudogymnoascus sp. VKM F-4281 (FW-2241)]
MAKSDTSPSGANAAADEEHRVLVQEFLKSASSTDLGNVWGESICTTDLKVISATAKPTGRVVFEYTCQASHANRLGNLHGGCASTIFDICTTTALVPISKPDFWSFVGVSRTLNVTYLRPVPVGETVIIECDVVAIGKRLWLHLPSRWPDMSFLSLNNDALIIGRFFNLSEHDGNYYRQLLSTVADVPIPVLFTTLLLICAPLVIALGIYASSASEEQPRGCRKLGIKTKSNLSNEFDKKFALGWPLSTSEVPAKRWTVQSMWIYPVKSCRGVELDHADIITTGMKYDRQFTFAQLKNSVPITETDEKKQTARTWEFITQRKFPRLATVKVEVWVPDHSGEGYHPDCDDVEGGGVVVIRFPYQQPGWRGKLEKMQAVLKGSVPERQFRVPFDPTPSQVQKAGYKYENVVIWKDTVNALNLEMDVPKELKEYLGVSNKLSLLRVDNSALREVYRCAPKAEDLGYQPVTGFQDAYPLHIMNLASVRDLEQKMPQAKGVPQLSARRFRANIIVTGPEPYEEDTWKRIRIGSYEFAVSCRTARCKLPNVNPTSGEVHASEPDRTLRRVRNVDAGAGKYVGCLGMQVVPISKESVMDVGDEIIPLEYGEHVYVNQ